MGLKTRADTNRDIVKEKVQLLDKTWDPVTALEVIEDYDLKMSPQLSKEMDKLFDIGGELGAGDLDKIVAAGFRSMPENLQAELWDLLLPAYEDMDLGGMA